MSERKFALVRFTPGALVKREEVEEQLPEVMPLADIFETSDAFTVVLDLPGAAKESVRVNVGSGELSVHAIVRGHLPEQATVVIREIGAKQYRRYFRLGSGIDQERIDARYDNGMLTITLPKTDALKKREIIIQ